jgi:hypothetical protein
MIKLQIFLAKALSIIMKILGIKFPTLSDQIEKFIKGEIEDGGTGFAPEVFPMTNEGREGWAITVVFTNKNGEKKCMRHLFLPQMQHVNEIKIMMLNAIKKLS